MACTKLLALCLLMVAARSIHAESDADAESGAFYGYSGGAAVLRSYPAYRRSYYSPHAYRRPYGAYHSPSRRYSYRTLGPSPAPAHLPIPQYQQYQVAEPAYAPVPAPAYAGPLRGVPAVPVAHVQTYGGPEYVAAPAPAPVEYVGSFNELLASAPAAFPARAPYSLPAPVAARAPAPYSLPAPVAARAPAPYSRHVVKSIPAVATSSQYHAQDELGNVSYGYKNPNSAKEERRDSYGNVVGAYSYIDASGIPKQLSYVADDFGFRVTGSHGLGVAPTPPH